MDSEKQLFIKTDGQSTINYEKKLLFYLLVQRSPSYVMHFQVWLRVPHFTRRNDTHYFCK